jgi:hypothetical protein
MNIAMYIAIMLQTWSVTLNEERGLRVTEESVTGRKRELHDEERPEEIYKTRSFIRCTIHEILLG